MSARERLDAIDARTTAATPGPWIVDQAGQNRRRTMIGAPDFGGRYVGFLDIDHITRNARDNGAFIAEARDDVPVMANALRAILALHQRAERGENWPAWCTHDAQAWPCATARIVETELAR